MRSLVKDSARRFVPQPTTPGACVMATVLVTGTSRGIGLESALAFARAGHSVAATMRSPERAPDLARIAEREQLPIKVFAMDVDDDASVRDAMGRIQAAL